MVIKKFENRDEWLAFRSGKITGTRLKDVIRERGTGYKRGFWELIAERVALPADGENPMDRGIRLEDEALQRFIKETGKKVDINLIMWISEEDENIAISPDATIGKICAIEVKCVNSPAHIEALITQKVPKEYYHQTVHYFIVNPKLKTLYLVFYDPRMPDKSAFFYLTINREEVEKDVEDWKKQAVEIIKEIEKITNQLTF